MLLKIYANFIDGQEDATDDRITAALAADRDRETLAATPGCGRLGPADSTDQS